MERRQNKKRKDIEPTKILINEADDKKKKKTLLRVEVTNSRKLFCVWRKKKKKKLKARDRKLLHGVWWISVIEVGKTEETGWKGKDLAGLRR